MNKIIRTHYPASRLPEELRGGLPPDALVKVEVEQEEAQNDADLMEEMFRVFKPDFASKEDVDDYARKMRDEAD